MYFAESCAFLASPVLSSPCLSARKRKSNDTFHYKYTPNSWGKWSKKPILASQAVFSNLYPRKGAFLKICVLPILEFLNSLSLVPCDMYTKKQSHTIFTLAKAPNSHFFCGKIFRQVKNNKTEKTFITWGWQWYGCSRDKKHFFSKHSHLLAEFVAALTI